MTSTSLHGLREVRVAGDRHPAPFLRATLPGGLTLIVKPIRALPIVAVDAWVGVGAAHEPPGVEGIAHFLEHMFFKGTPAHPLGEMDGMVKNMGGYNNAATSLENTHYFIVAPSPHWETALALLADGLQNLALPGEELAREREVVKEEINRKEDSPAGRLYTVLSETALAGTPYGHSVLGTRESLDRIGRDEMGAYWRRHYNTANTVVAVVGDVDPDAALRAVQSAFDYYRRGSPSAIAAFTAPRPRPAVLRESKDVGQTYLALAATTPGREHPSYHALELASLVVGEGPTSLLSRRLERELNLVTGISAWSYDLRGTGLLGVDAVCDPDQTERVVEEIGVVLSEAVRGAITPAAVERAKRILRADFDFDNETASSISGTLAEFELLFGGAERFADYLSGIEAVRPEECVRVLEEFFAPASRLTVIVEPDAEGHGSSGRDEARPAIAAAGPDPA
ncbi:MAG: insulinase family protein [Gemmatimonadetes bacterium]|nr:insulinase family protein [Gemmatimonadota bacterium]